ncbi:MAG: helix-turn-helix transcriptional regulator [Oscillospiraceae bacterium]|nr:helix-turn-helix transcriptional regulator [Oscillospiraceae bacterium]
MDTLNKIIELLTAQNRQQKELTDYLGVEKSTFSAWKNGKSASYKKYLPEIASFFSVTVDELLGNSVDRGGLDEAYFSLAKNAQDEGIDPEDIKLAISTIQKLKQRNTGEE